jgi:hypothetical protein
MICRQDAGGEHHRIEGNMKPMPLGVHRRSDMADGEQL